jgi:hypothetical protein
MSIAADARCADCVSSGVPGGFPYRIKAASPPDAFEETRAALRIAKQLTKSQVVVLAFGYNESIDVLATTRDDTLKTVRVVSVRWRHEVGEALAGRRHSRDWFQNKTILGVFRRQLVELPWLDSEQQTAWAESMLDRLAFQTWQNIRSFDLLGPFVPRRDARVFSVG